MNTTLAALLLAVTATVAFGHADIEIGPEGGRILEFSKDESMHGEVIEKGGKLHVRLLDKEMKRVAIKDQTLTATSGDRANPEKLAVEKHSDHFLLPAVKEGQWLIFQYRESAKGKPVTARFEYDTKPCGECKKAEWLCACGSQQSGQTKK